MSMMLRRGLMIPKAESGLPAEYLAVQYLESTGTQCIDTGIIPGAGTSVLIRKGQSGGSYLNTIFGCGSSRDQFTISGLYINYLSSVNQTVTGNPQTASCTLEMSSGVVYVDGTQVLDLSSSTGECSQTLGIFAKKLNNGTFERFDSMKVYAFKMWQNSVLIRDMIPCIRISDSKPGMYDLVGRQFYVNQGTGEFLTGYISDGLVMQLDGIDRGGVSGQWKDLVGGKIVTLSGDYSEQTNYVEFPASTTPYGLGTFDSNTNIKIEKSLGTIETACELTVAESVGRPVYSAGNGYIGCSLASMYSDVQRPVMRYYCASATMQLWVFPNTITGLKYTASANKDIAYCNGEAGSLGSVSSWSSTPTPSIATRGSGNPFKGKMYAVRLYNRLLTQAEMLHNQRVDNTRFNLGLTI